MTNQILYDWALQRWNLTAQGPGADSEKAIRYAEIIAQLEHAEAMNNLARALKDKKDA